MAGLRDEDMRLVWFKILAGSLLAGLSSIQPAVAHDDQVSYSHKLVIQVSTADTDIQKRVLNEAAYLKRVLNNNIDISVVAYGPGVALLTKASYHTNQIRSLMLQGATFYACDTTLKNSMANKGRELELLHGVSVIANGFKQIMELQNQGYAYLLP